MLKDEALTKAARAIYDACYTAAPVSFDQARAAGLLYYHRATEAAEKALAAVGMNAAALP